MYLLSIFIDTEWNFRTLAHMKLGLEEVGYEDGGGGGGRRWMELVQNRVQSRISVLELIKIFVFC
jgi:hypothetical protein